MRARRRRDPDHGFPASAGPWVDVYFDNRGAAASFAKSVRKVMGYHASVDDVDPTKVITNVERWEIGDLMRKLRTSNRNAPLRVESLRN